MAPTGRRSGGGIGDRSARHGKSLVAVEGPEGPQLFVGGAFGWVDGLPAAAAAIWDGSEWNRMEGGLVGTTQLPVVRSMTAYEDDIGRSVMMAGLFHQSGPVLAQNVARWGCTGGDLLCYGDCDGNESLDFFDFLCFQQAFGLGDPYADCDRSGELDFFDFLCFQSEFAAGCE